MPNQQMGIPMGMNMPPIEMNNPMLNNNNFMDGFNDGMMERQMAMDRFDDGIMEQENQKLNVVFETTTGIKKNIVVDYGTTVDNLLKKYLNFIDRPLNEVFFIYNGIRIELGDETKIEDYFKALSRGTPRIIVSLK